LATSSPVMSRGSTASGPAGWSRGSSSNASCSQPSDRVHTAWARASRSMTAASRRHRRQGRRETSGPHSAPRSTAARRSSAAGTTT
jgi:hypothetical protein